MDLSELYDASIFIAYAQASTVPRGHQTAPPIRAPRAMHVPWARAVPVRRYRVLPADTVLQEVASV